MKRKTLDTVFSTGGLLIAALLVVFGVVMQQQASFAQDYVDAQLSAQAIYFTPSADLSDEEAEAACLVQYGTGDEAARLLRTGQQAECYANEYIGLHLREATEGMTYAQLGGPQRAARASLAEAIENNGPNVEELQAELDRINGMRDTAFRGETLRGLLLTVYGFSVLGSKAAVAATVAFIGAGLMVLLSLAGFAHAMRTPVTEPFAPVELVKTG
ncbi:MAG TPA: hypothetical protein VJR05_02725 [Acidimicrobiia bacterium]|nr:hypothetical protein [Acidimicrobiia bacterium]